MSFQTAFARLTNEQKSTEAPSSAAAPITTLGIQASSEPKTQTPAPQVPAPTSSHKAPITTHILDQTTGRPGSGVRVHLHNDSDAAAKQHHHHNTRFQEATKNPLTPPVRLHLSAHTDEDGRITSWNQVHLHTDQPRGSEGITTTDEATTSDANTLLAAALADQKRYQSDLAIVDQNASAVQTWHLVFETGVYFKGDTMWEEVDLVLKIDANDARGHWHVPLLLGPWGYTTYRGS